jgi:hypothetical protein
MSRSAVTFGRVSACPSRCCCQCARPSLSGPPACCHHTRRCTSTRPVVDSRPATEYHVRGRVKAATGNDGERGGVGASAARVVVASAGSVCWHAGRVLAKRRGECELTLISMYSTALNWYRTHTLTCQLSSLLANGTHTPRSRHFQSPCGCIGASPIHATVSFCRKGDLTLQNAESHKVFDPSCQSYSREGVCLCGSRSLRLVIRSPPLLQSASTARLWSRLRCRLTFHSVVTVRGDSK